MLGNIPNSSHLVGESQRNLNRLIQGIIEADVIITAWPFQKGLVEALVTYYRKSPSMPLVIFLHKPGFGPSEKERELIRPDSGRGTGESAPDQALAVDISAPDFPELGRRLRCLVEKYRGTDTNP